MPIRHLIMCALACLATAAANAEPADPLAVAYIERELAAAGVPGASVVLIRDHKIAWAQGFGVTDTITQTPVTPETAFPAASNGKPVAAWLIVQLAAQGVIDLKKPVLAQAPVNLPDTPQHQAITPWHLLTHTSGLGNFLADRSRSLDFAPGERFDYSGVGFMVLQELLEAKTKQPLDAYARKALFEPLKIERTWYGERPANVAAIAAPHVDLAYALAPALIAVGGIFALLVIVVVVVVRLRTGQWSLDMRKMTISAAAALTLTLIVFYRLSDSWPLSLWFILAPLFILALPAAIAYTAARAIGGSETRRGVVMFVITTALVAMLVKFGGVRLPLPASNEANAASSLYATAPDLASFMIELAEPTLGDVAATHEMTTAHQRIDDVASWGLGIGVERHAKGRDLWQWGSNPGAKSLMVISAETGDGVVILTNADGGASLTRQIARRLLGREGCWRTACAE